MTPAQQRAVAEAYIAAFFRMHLGGEVAFKPYFDGSAGIPALGSFAEVLPSYHPPPTDRLDVNRFLDPDALDENDLGEAVTQVGATLYDLCGFVERPADLCSDAVDRANQPHTPPEGLRVSQLRFGWGPFMSARVTNAIPPAFGDVSGRDAITFRAAHIYCLPTDPNCTGPDLAITLEDAAGQSATEVLSDWSDALFVQPKVGLGTPHMLLSTVRIPLAAFSGVDLTTVRKIVIAPYQTMRGKIVMTDLAFVD